MKNPIVTFEMENGDVFKAELYPEIAANTVANFVNLVQDGRYDQTVKTSADQLDQQKSLPGKCPLYQFPHDTDAERDYADDDEDTANIVEKSPGQQNIIRSSGILVVQQGQGRAQILIHLGQRKSHLASPVAAHLRNSQKGQ